MRVASCSIPNSPAELFCCRDGIVASSRDGVRSRAPGRASPSEPPQDTHVDRIETRQDLQALCRLAGEQATGALEDRTAPRGRFAALRSGKWLLTLGLLGGASAFAAAMA